MNSKTLEAVGYLQKTIELLTESALNSLIQSGICEAKCVYHQKPGKPALSSDWLPLRVSPNHFGIGTDDNGEAIFLDPHQVTKQDIYCYKNLRSGRYYFVHGHKARYQIRIKEPVTNE